MQLPASTIVHVLAWRVLLLPLALVATMLASAGPARAQVSTQDASGCNVNVCVFLQGSGLSVTSWRTTAYSSSYQCGYAYFWRNGGVTRTVYACGSGTVSVTWSSPGTFSHGDQLCNTWTIASGNPCKTIYS